MRAYIPGLDAIDGFTIGNVHESIGRVLVGADEDAATDGGGGARGLVGGCRLFGGCGCFARDTTSGTDLLFGGGDARRLFGGAEDGFTALLGKRLGAILPGIRLGGMTLGTCVGIRLGAMTIGTCFGRAELALPEGWSRLSRRRLRRSPQLVCDPALLGVEDCC